MVLQLFPSISSQLSVPQLSSMSSPALVHQLSVQQMHPRSCAPEAKHAHCSSANTLAPAHWHRMLASAHRHAGISTASACWLPISGIRLFASAFSHLHSRLGCSSAFLSSARRHWHVELALTLEAHTGSQSHEQGISRGMGRGDAGVLVRVRGGVTRRHILCTSSWGSRHHTWSDAPFSGGAR